MAGSRKELVNVMTSRSVKRKKRRRMQALALLCCLALCAGLAAGGINVTMIRSAEPAIITPEQAQQGGYDCILVLGAMVWPGGVPSHMLEDRCRRGVELYHAGAAPVIIMSGDHGQHDYDEVNTMKQYAVDAGVPSSDVFMDHAGFSTYDSMYRARDIFGAKKVLIVTQDYHLTRALYIAQQLGLEAEGVTCNYRAYANQTQNDFREFLARVKAWIYCILQPKATPGEKIPLNLDGNVTNDKGMEFLPSNNVE